MYYYGKPVVWNLSYFWHYANVFQDNPTLRTLQSKAVADPTSTCICLPLLPGCFVDDFQVFIGSVQQVNKKINVLINSM